MNAELRGALFVAAGVLLGATASRFLASDPGPPLASPANGAGQASVELVTAIERLDRSIQELSSRAAPNLAAGPTREPVSGEDALTATSSLIDRLEAVADQISTARSVPSSGALAPGLREIPMNQAAVRQAFDALLIEDNEQRVKAETGMILAPREDVVRRFGRPTEINITESGGEVWMYDFGDDQLWVFLSPQGYVTRITT